jgi:hypothetical protein
MYHPVHAKTETFPQKACSRHFRVSIDIVEAQSVHKNTVPEYATGYEQVAWIN